MNEKQSNKEYASFLGTLQYFSVSFSDGIRSRPKTYVIAVIGRYSTTRGLNALV